MALFYFVYAKSSGGISGGIDKPKAVSHPSRTQAMKPTKAYH